MLHRTCVERFMEHKAISLGLLAAALLGCSGGSFGGSSDASAGQAGAAAATGVQDAAGGASGGQDSSAVGGEPGAGASDSGGSGGSPAAGGSDDTGGAPPGGGSGGSEPTGGVGGDPSGGAAGQDPTGGSGGTVGARCAKEEAVTSLPASLTVSTWSYTRTGTNHCASCVSEPCLHCSLAWLSPEWHADGTVRFYAGTGTTCSGLAIAGECGAEEECALDFEHIGSLMATVEISFTPCTGGWCAEQVDVLRFVPVDAACLTTYGARDPLNETAAEEIVAAIEATVWECP